MNHVKMGANERDIANIGLADVYVRMYLCVHVCIVLIYVCTHVFYVLYLCMYVIMRTYTSACDIVMHVYAMSRRFPMYEYTKKKTVVRKSGPHCRKETYIVYVCHTSCTDLTAAGSHALRVYALRVYVIHRVRTSLPQEAIHCVCTSCVCMPYIMYGSHCRRKPCILRRFSTQ